MKRFFYASAAVLMLAIAYHLGAGTATAQAPSDPLVAVDGAYAYTANGDVYLGGGAGSRQTWSLFANVFAGGPTPALHESWGSLKARYAPNRGTAQPSGIGK